jgi:hypothetical protein
MMIKADWDKAGDMERYKLACAKCGGVGGNGKDGDTLYLPRISLRCPLRGSQLYPQRKLARAGSGASLLDHNALATLLCK